VGGALSSAKGAISSWWTSLNPTTTTTMSTTTPNSQQDEERGEDATNNTKVGEEIANEIPQPQPQEEMETSFGADVVSSASAKSFQHT
jgi:hypothetical protein